MTYEFREGFLRGSNVGGGFIHFGRCTGDLDNSCTVGGYACVEAAVFYTFDEHARFSLNARDLLDRRYNEQPCNQFDNASRARRSRCSPRSRRSFEPGSRWTSPDVAPPRPRSRRRHPRPGGR